MEVASSAISNLFVMGPGVIVIAIFIMIVGLRRKRLCQQSVENKR
jgi:hypothetical protein